MIQSVTGHDDGRVLEREHRIGVWVAYTDFRIKSSGACLSTYNPVDTASDAVTYLANK